MPTGLKSRKKPSSSIRESIQLRLFIDQNIAFTVLLFFFRVAWEWMKKADMHAKGISLVYKYEEGHDVDFDIGLYFYEQLCKYCDQNPNLKTTYPRSIPEMMTSIKRKVVSFHFHQFL